MIKWFADNTELTTEKGKENNVLIFGGVLVNEEAENKIIDLMKTVKGEYTFPDLPVKWNFKDLEKTYKELEKVDDYKKMLAKSSEWRTALIENSLDIDYKIIVVCLERHESDKPIKTIKETLVNISFAQALMRVGMFAKYQTPEKKFEVILDWPESSNPKPFNREYYYAYNRGHSANEINYLSGKLKDLGFNESLYYTKSTHSSVLQFSDIIIGATKDFVLKTLYGIDHSLGYNLTELFKVKFCGYPNKTIEYGLNYSPKNENYKKIQKELNKKNGL